MEELRRHAAMADKTLELRRPPSERPVHGDRDLLAAAMLNLGLGALRRVPTRGRLTIDIVETDAGVRFRAAAPGTALPAAEKLRIFEPYGRRPGGSATYGMGLALAHAVVGLHDGNIWVEELESRAGLRVRVRAAVGSGGRPVQAGRRWRACRSDGGASVTRNRLGLVLLVLMAALAGRVAASDVRVQDLCKAVVDDPNYKIRVQAALVLGKVRDPAAVPALIKALTDPNATVRGIAAGALGDIGDPLAADALRDLARRETDSFVKSQAGKALALLNGAAEQAGQDLPGLRSVHRGGQVGRPGGGQDHRRRAGP